MKPKTEQEFIDALADLLEHDDPEESIEEIDEELRAAGLDPEAVGAKMAAAAEQAYRDSDLHWRNRAPAERAAAEGRLHERTSLASRQSMSRQDLVREISSIANRSSEAQRRVQAHFRNFESASEEELAELLDELLFLADPPVNE